MTKIGLYGLPEPALPPRPPSRWRWAWRVFWAVTIPLCLMMLVLSMLGGNGASLKQAVESFVSETSGHQADIGTLNRVSFFPVVGADFSGLSVTAANGDVVSKFSHINLSAPFWRTIFSRPALRTLDVQDGWIAAGSAAPERVEVQHLRIVVDENRVPHVIFKGRYGPHDVEAMIEMRAYTNLFGAVSFVLGSPSPFRFKIGPLDMEGTLGTGRGGRRIVTVDFINIDGVPNKTRAKVEILRRVDGVGIIGDMNFTGDEETVPAPLSFDVFLMPGDTAWGVTGNVSAGTLAMESFMAKDGPMGVYAVLSHIYRGETARADLNADDYWRGMTGQVSLDIDRLTQGGNTIGPIKAPLAIGVDAQGAAQKE